MSATRLFPGIAFQVETPVRVDLPRMDIAAFVGFAQRGPVQIPVAIATYADFVNLFGDIYRLAWDGQEGLWQTACLATAVKTFFTQGGRRCWVVRVASAAAKTTSFPLTGLLQFDPLQGYRGIAAIARSAGSWADHLQTRLDLLSDSLGFAPTTGRGGDPLQLNLRAAGNLALQTGDLLQLDFGDRRHRAYIALESNAPVTEITFSPSQIHWFYRLQTSLFPLTGTVHTVNAATPKNTAGTLALNELQLTENSNFVNHATLTLTNELSVTVGDWLRWEMADRTFWLQVESLTDPTEFTVTNLWAQGFDPTTVDKVALERVQRLQMALQVRSPETSTENLDLTLLNLAGAAPHPRFIGYLPTDKTLLAQPPLNNPAAALWQEVRLPRFPLGVNLAANTLVLPLGLETGLPWRGGNVSSELPLVRDGLVPEVSDYQALSGTDWVEFLPQLFLDAALRQTGRRSLLTEAHDRLYLQGKALTGIHALLAIEEISMVALPDAAHRGWQLTAVQSLPPEPSPTEPTVPDLCATNSPFFDCNQPPADDSSAETPTPAAPTPATQWQLLEPKEYFATGLLEIQQAIARFAAARGDFVALLSAPKHYRTPELLEHQAQLLSNLRREADNTDSFVALYHPWLVTRALSGTLLQQPPTGAIAGIMADQSLRQGAWLAPANEVIQGILATVPTFAPDAEQSLYQAGINPIRQLPRGFMPWGNFTQSNDSDLEALNLRRLLILLRRLAIREGQTAVFAPHSPAFRRRLKQQFEQVLNRLFTLGAFAGGDRSQAYQVTLDTSLNTQTTIEKGQLIIELKIAPSRPMTFITVRLIQGDRDQIAVQEVF
jgi:hypothetical protein